MRRIAVLVAVLGLLLLVGLGMLVARALESVERERAMRHEVLAERVFDEVEAELSGLIAQEEARPFLQYRFFYVPEGQVPGAEGLSRSPLSELPEEDWLVGWFQLDPGGGFSTPYEPRDEELATSVGWARAPAQDARVETLRRIAAALPVQPSEPPDLDEPLVQKNVEPKAEPAVEPKEKSAGARPSKDKARSVGTGGKADLDGLASGESGLLGTRDGNSDKKNLDPYGIGSLNKGASSRSGRQQRVTKSSAENVRSYQFPEENAAVLRGDDLPSVEFGASAGDAVAQVATGRGEDGDLGGQSDDAELAEVIEEIEDEEQLDEGLRLEERERTAMRPAAEEPTEGLGDEELDDGFAVVEAESKRESRPSRPARGALRRKAAPQSAQAPEPMPGGVRDERDASVASVVGAVADESVASAGAAPEDSVTEDSVTEDSAPEASVTEDWASEVAAAPPPKQVSAGRGPAPNAAPTVASTTASPAASSPVGSTSKPVGLRAPRAQSAKRAEAAPPGEVDVEISPFRGHRVDEDTLVLYRTVRIGELVYVQGLALLLPRLAGWLDTQVLGSAEIAPFLDLAWNVGRAASDLRADFVFEHAFADPFGSLTATSYLRALPEPRGTGRAWILQLTFLLVLVGLLGLFALWRMVSVVVQFAERRNNFVAAVSHELKTPLTAIRMYSEMLRDGYVSSDEKREEYYATMAAESERLSRLIQNVLELSRLEKEGTGGGELVNGDIRPVLEEALRVLERHARDRGFALRLEVEPDLPAVRFERDGLLQVLINLVDNGIKFSKDAEPREVVVEAARKGHGVQLRIRDHGPGVPSKQLARIFQPFYRGERELTRRTKGTGIGLALVKGIVDRMGGSVTVRNHPDGGFEVKVGLVGA